jgi:hypothetical protein
MRYSVHPLPFLQQAFEHLYKDDVNGFSSTSDICFMDLCIVYVLCLYGMKELVVRDHGLKCSFKSSTRTDCRRKAAT